MRLLAATLLALSLSLVVEARPLPAPTATTEDSPDWDCERQGNLVCNPGYLP